MNKSLCVFSESLRLWWCTRGFVLCAMFFFKCFFTPGAWSPVTICRCRSTIVKKTQNAGEVLYFKYLPQKPPSQYCMRSSLCLVEDKRKAQQTSKHFCTHWIPPFPVLRRIQNCLGSTKKRHLTVQNEFAGRCKGVVSITSTFYGAVSASQSRGVGSGTESKAHALPEQMGKFGGGHKSTTGTVSSRLERLECAARTPPFGGEISHNRRQIVEKPSPGACTDHTA